jgi:reverse transcriptase-like protein
MKESTTVVIRKERKQDYSLPQSYRPVALENTLAKVIEKIVADRISEAAETHNLLPWTQMGARKKRSTLSALELLTSCVQTAWRARPGCVVSMLSLDISGAFDHVSHERLLWVLKRKGFPQWILRFIQSFLEDRKTKICFTGHESPWIRTDAGVPQGSPLSPILFLFYISELLESLQYPNSDTLTFGFVDDTNLVTWGPSAQDNCRRLDEAHSRCLAWAKRYGVTFSPEKYQLIHFTRKRNNADGDLASAVKIEEHTVKPAAKLKILGVWVDPKLQWKEQVKQAASSGNAAYAALSGITASTWGPSMRRSRLLYTAVVRPAMTYGSQVWGVRHDGEPAAAKPIQKVQNQCLRRIAGAYKRTPIAALERETAVPPISLYTEARALQYAAETSRHAVTKDIQQQADRVWQRLKGETQRRRGRPTTRRPPTSSESLRSKAQERENEIKELLAHRASSEPQGRRRRPARQGGNHHRWKATTYISMWADLEWKRRWMRRGQHQRAATWHTPWTQQVLKLYEGLKKHEATMLFLLRTEVIGLNAWLASINVPGVLPRCPCGHGAQTVRHVLLQCPQLSHLRPHLIAVARCEDLHRILSTPGSAQAAARMLIRSGLLAQFHLADEIDREGDNRAPLPGLDYWQ